MRPKRSRTLSAAPFKRLVPAVSGALPIFLLLLFVLVVYRLFIIDRVECTLNSSPCPAEIAAKVDKHLGSNMLFLNQKELSSSVQSSFPADQISIGFKMFHTLSVKIKGGPTSVMAQLSLAKDLPVLSFDGDPSSTDSAVFEKPTEEISRLGSAREYLNFEIWASGLMTPTASSESKIKYLFTDKPSAATVKAVFSLLRLLDKYLEVDQVWILDTRVFLSQPGQPDIIVSVPFDEDNLVQALQSLTYLTTIKKDAKVIDLRFKNPIIR